MDIRQNPFFFRAFREATSHTVLYYSRANKETLRDMDDEASHCNRLTKSRIIEQTL